VETYLNYDCDRTALDNMFERLIEELSKSSGASVQISPILQQQYEERKDKKIFDWQARESMPPPLSTVAMSQSHDNESEIPKEYILKRLALDSLVEVLRSLVNWSQQGIADVTGVVPPDQDPRVSISVDDIHDSVDPSQDSSTGANGDTPIPPSTPVPDDDPEQLEKAKQRKTALYNAIKLFNFKPKKGMKELLAKKFIPSESPEDIAHFLLNDDRLDKAQIGEFLGEGDPKHIEIMHAFVDGMDFTKRRFVDALRQFLQSFRLPGEAQKIDRFMLKFANRYVTGNPNAFANADTAYVLAFSVIMLNTDLHSGKIVKRMTKEGFIKNNKGINDNSDLPDEYLMAIYDEILSNEIVLRSEREAAAANGILQPTSGGIASGLGQALATVGRDLQREAYLQQSEEIASRTELLYKNLWRNQRKNSAKSGGSKFIPATSFKHVGPMFEVTWTSFLAGLSEPFQNAHNIEVIKLCTEGMRLAIRIACLFDLEIPRQAFVSALKASTNLDDLPEMKAKNVEALKVLLEIAQTEGNLLKESWLGILMCVSQLDRLQLISGGVDERAIPDVSKARIVAPSRGDEPKKSMQSQRPSRPRPRSNTHNTIYSMEIALEARSDEVIKGVDRIFTNTANLDGDAIVYFVEALTQVSWEEIKISGQNEFPRTYSLQKLVEISYYNMNRVRYEWAKIWVVLGEHFNAILCHNNTEVVYFALDSLRQLSMRFMEMDEPPGFNFQKDFLRPFEHVMANSNIVAVKENALFCLERMIQARGQNIRSGWRTMFAAFTLAAGEQYESIVNLAFNNVNQIYKTRFGMVISQGAFADLIVCLTAFSKNMRFQKKGLQAMETLKSIIPTMLKTPECPLSSKSTANSDGSIHTDESLKKQPSRTSQEEAFWFPVLFAFHDVLMTADDLEIRSKAQNYLFESLIRYGGNFPPDFWDIVWRQLLYPIFMVLKSKSEMSNVLKHEELSVWLSTTMIQALRSMIDLFTHYFDALEYMLGRFLDLLALCICQENDTIARIGSNCLQQLILQNVTKFKPEHWTKVVGCFVDLFEQTTAYQLFSAATTPSTPSIASNGFENGAVRGDSASSDASSLKINGAVINGAVRSEESMTDDEGLPRMPGSGPSGLEDYKPQPEVVQQPVQVTAARRKFFHQIITRCILQLLIIETVNELFSNDAVYAQIPSPELLRLMGLLKKSFLFAKKFNNDKELRMRLWREGFMKQPPNLLKQESGSASTYVSILLRMYHDESEERKRNRPDTEAALIPLCADIIRSYTLLDEETQQRNIITWQPVVVDVMEGYTNLPEEGFKKHITVFYPLAVDLLSKDINLEIRMALQSLLRRIGEIGLGLPPMPAPLPPASPEGTVRMSLPPKSKNHHRRGSRAN
jgi:brefeldin A-inhibited guanine nucleotide-exchange protein